LDAFSVSIFAMRTTSALAIEPWRSEPPRKSRRPVGLSQAATPVA